MLKDTGERVIPELMNPKNGMLLEHYARYHFAVPYTHGRVLDIATGAGYGPQILLRYGTGIERVVAVDVSEDAIRYAREHYDDERIDWRLADGADPSIVQQLGMFDTIISFETIEHIEQDFQFVDNLYRMLKPGGVAVISTPFGKGRHHPCADPFHVCQYTEEEFRELMQRFDDVMFFHQVNETIEMPVPGKKYWLQLAVCRKANEPISSRH
ncbi:MAG: class I SAM-dependent methyltransferase [Bacillaceae bacterium]|nr:class I SAM-dependent methyltransferase [Bacillaceae bacterium]